MTTTLRRLGNDRILEHELIWQYISPKDLDKALTVHPVDPLELAQVKVGRKTLLDSFAKAKASQRKIVASYVKRLKAGSMTDDEKTLVFSGDLLLDGHHRAVAAIQANTPMLFVDVQELGD